MLRKLKLISGCAVGGCSNSNSIIYWYHGPGERNCASESDKYHNNLYIYEDGTIECKDCWNKDNISNWKFKCRNHDFLYPTYQGILKFLSVLGHIEADENFIDNCMDAARLQRKKFKG